MDSPFMGDVLLLLGVVATRDARAIEGKPAHLSAVHVQVSDRPIECGGQRRDRTADAGLFRAAGQCS
jgi:hypothetical protein